MMGVRAWAWLYVGCAKDLKEWLSHPFKSSRFGLGFGFCKLRGVGGLYGMPI